MSVCLPVGNAYLVHRNVGTPRVWLLLTFGLTCAECMGCPHHRVIFGKCIWIGLRSFSVALCTMVTPWKSARKLRIALMGSTVRCRFPLGIIEVAFGC
jgi:hypothetical protein